MKSKFNVWTGLASCLGLLVVAGEALSLYTVSSFKPFVGLAIDFPPEI